MNITLAHALCRIGTVAVNAPTGYSLTVNSLSATARIKDTFDDYNGLSESYVETKSLSIGVNDVWFVPGAICYFDEEYGLQQKSPFVTINYTLTKGDFTKTYEKSQDFTLTQGKTHNLTINITTDEATGIQLNTTVTAWADQATTVTIN